MATLRQATTGTTAPGAESGIKEFILAKERELNLYREDIENGEKRLDTVQKAIENLEIALPEAKRVLEIQKENVEAILKISVTISNPNATFSSPLKDEESSKVLSEDLLIALAAQAEAGASIVKPMIKFSQDAVTDISRMRHKMEVELRSWRFSRNIHRKSLDRSRRALKAGQRELDIAKQTFSKVPVEVWIDIFRWRAQGDLDEFYTKHSTRPFQPTAMVLSAVCRLWRNIIAEEPDLWRHIAMHPCASWSSNKLELLKFSLDKATRQKSLAVNISQSLIWGNAGNYHYNQTSCPSLVDSNIVSGSYDITIVTSVDDSFTMARVNQLPFSHPSKLTLVNRPGHRHGNFFSHIPSFRSVRSLEVVDPDPYSLDSLQLSTRFPTLTKLFLEANVFSSTFNPSLLFPSTLQELRVRHSGQGHFPAMQSDVSLPYLAILEITPPTTSIFQTVKVRSLQQLILCGPKRTATVAPNSPPNESKLRLGSVVHLEFRSWLDPTLIAGVTACDAVNILRSWGTQMPLVRRLKFVDCYVDGKELLDVLKSWRNGDGPKGPVPWEITLDCCTGITRSQCEDLWEMVEKFNTFV
ncbi:hypothetical protein FRB91_010934 [Serendipita sp. 411]|nr:hypothetical protein FRB91_010934 [Serendipita sp. 411]